jgi:hypothetical protein
LGEVEKNVHEEEQEEKAKIVFDNASARILYHKGVLGETGSCVGCEQNKLLSRETYGFDLIRDRLASIHRHCKERKFLFVIKRSGLNGS